MIEGRNEVLTCVLFCSLLFFILSHPYSYKLCNNVINAYGKKGQTIDGIILHSLLFGIILYIVKKYVVKEKFVICDPSENEVLMQPDVDGKYIDVNKIKSIRAGIGEYSCKWPYEKRFIPRRDSNWCLKTYNNDNMKEMIE